MHRPEDVVIVLAEDDPGHARLIPGVPCRIGLTVSKPTGWSAPKPGKGPGGRPD